MIVNRSDLADILGVSPTTIDRRVSEGMPVAGAAQAQDDRQWKFDTAAVIAWLRRQAPRPSQVKRSQVELRIHNADAGLKEFELQQKQKTLIHLDDVAEVLEVQYATIRDPLQAIPLELVEALAAASDVGECRELLRTHVIALLTEIHELEVPDDETENPEP